MVTLENGCKHSKEDQVTIDFWGDTNWYALQSKPHRENLAAASVAGLEIEVFLPRISREQFVGGLRRLVSKPLFVGYFFARFCPLTWFGTIRHARGVLRVLGTSRYPIPLESQFISSIRERIQTDGFVRFEPRQFQAGDRVTIEQGPLAGWMGKVERQWDDGKRVAILLEAISKARVLVERRWLAAAPAF
jgi:transcriptional antiterminator RfaH